MNSLVGREKTTAGRQEIASRMGTLDRRTRALLITVDGRSSGTELLARAHQLGLDLDVVLALQQAGLIQHVGELGHVSNLQPSAGSPHPGTKQNIQFRKRSLAAARMYLMDVMVRTLGTAEHPVRTLLVEATDRGSVEQAFEECLQMLRETARPSMVAQIEESFCEQLPIRE